MAMILHVLAHDVKNWVIQREFMCSNETISWHFNIVLLAVLRLHDGLLKTITSYKWVHISTMEVVWGSFLNKLRTQTSRCVMDWFTSLYTMHNYLGALDDTYIKVNVPASDQLRYRTRKRNVAMNFLGVCDTKGYFVFVLANWEGSTTDSCIIRDAISRPNCLKVPKGKYVHIFFCQLYFIPPELRYLNRAMSSQGNTTYAMLCYGFSGSIQRAKKTLLEVA